MAIDTAEKRFSMMGVGLPFLKKPIPQGALGRSGRSTMLDLYSGITLSSGLVNLKHAWDHVTKDITSLKIKTAISSLKFKVTR